MGPSALPPLTDFWHDLDPCEFSVSYKSWHQQLWNDGNSWIFICASPVLCAVGSRTTSWMSPSLRDCVVRVEGDRRPNRTGLSRKNMRSKGGSWSLITTAAWSSFSNAYVQSLSHMWLPGRQASRSFTISQRLLRLMSKLWTLNCRKGNFIFPWAEAIGGLGFVLGRCLGGWTSLWRDLGWDIQIVSLKSCCSVAQSSPTLHNIMTATCRASLSSSISQSLHKLMSIELVMPANHLVLCHPLLLLPSILPNIRVFSNDSALRIKWAITNP